MADTKLADLTALTTPSGDDILYIVDDPAGTPLDRKIALDNLFTRGTITADAPVLNMSQTWNNAAVTFTGLKFNVTSTASNASSLLMDLGTGGGTFVSKFKVDRSGTVYAVNFFGNGASTANGFGLSSSQILVYTSNGTLVNVFDTNGLKTASTARFGFTNTGDPSGTTDTILTRRAAANLRLGDADAAAPVAQTLSVQSVVAGTTNIAGANLTITGSQGTGTGAGGSIIFQVAPAGSSGSAQNALVSALTISNETALSNLPALTFTGRYIDLPDLFPNIRISNTLSFSMSNGTTIATLASGRFQFSSPTYLGWSEDGSSNGTADVRLFRDAANTLAQRNGANAQTFRVYNTYTDATTFERANIFWDSNVLKIGTEKGSVGGTARALELQTDGTTRLTIATNGLVDLPTTSMGAGLQQLTVGRIIYAGEGYRVGNANQVVWSNGADYNRGIGANSAGGLAVTNGSTGGQSLEFREMTAPAAPAANGVRIYAVDNGSGKTQLMALFATGAAQQIAIEP